MLNALRASFEGMRRVEAPKSLVLVTEGFILDPQRPSFIELERLAAAARTSVYALRLDQRGIDGSLSSAPAPGSAGTDRMALRQGLDFLANATRGQVFNVVTTPDSALRSIELDLSGYYLLGVESDPADRADEGRDVSVAVNRPGVTVRPRRRLLVDDPAATAKDLAARALASPLVSSAVPIRVAAFAFGGQERGKVQLAVRAEIGEGYSSPVSMVVGYLLLGADGKVVDSRGVERELMPLIDGVPSALQFAATISVDPGEYVLRITATDGSRVGSAERKVSARLHECGPPEDERPRRWRARVHDDIASTDRHFHCGVRQSARIRRSLRRIGGQHDGQVRGGAALGHPGADCCGCTRPARRRRSRDLLAASLRSGGFLPDATFCVQSPRLACEAQPFGLVRRVRWPADFVIPPSSTPSSEEIFLPVADERSPRCLRRHSEAASLVGDERGGMEQA